MPMTLYYSPGAASLVVHWLLIELGEPFELRRLDFDRKEQKSDAYLAINPSGVVPTLVIDDVALSEAAAIVMHLADTHPEAGLAPAEGTVDRARYYQWMVYLANMLQPCFRAFYYPDEPAGPEHAEAVKARAGERAAACFDILDAHLREHGPYLLGERVSAADFQLAMLMRWSRNLQRPALGWVELRAHAMRMTSRPSFRALYAAEGLVEWP